jgi:Protein of unknown function (DUF5672)
MLNLPDVTLVILDVQAPELAYLALRDSVQDISFGEVIVCSDTDLKFPGARWVEVSKWDSLYERVKWFLYSLPNYIRTDFMIEVQWDGFIVDSAMWTDEFLNFDFIGAPWWYDDKLNVGNGCALRSLRLMHYLKEHQKEFPLSDAKEDDLICRHYRRRLEKEGFKWPSEQLASRYSFECTRPSHVSRHFMFHDSSNFPRVLSARDFAERYEMMLNNPYLRDSQKVVELRDGRKAAILPRLG